MTKTALKTPSDPFRMLNYKDIHELISALSIFFQSIFHVAADVVRRPVADAIGCIRVRWPAAAADTACARSCDGSSFAAADSACSNVTCVSR